jgi:hypothetical protein
MAANKRFQEASQRTHEGGQKYSPSDVRQEMADLAAEDLARAEAAATTDAGKRYADVADPFMATRPTVDATPIKEMIAKQRAANAKQILPSDLDLLPEYATTKPGPRDQGLESLLADVERGSVINPEGRTYAANPLAVRRSLDDLAYGPNGNPQAKRLRGSINEALHDPRMGMRPLADADARFTDDTNALKRFREQTGTRGDAVGKDGHVDVKERRQFSRFLNRAQEETIPGQTQELDLRRAKENPLMGDATKRAIHDVTDAAALEFTEPFSKNKIKGTMTEIIQIPGSGAISSNARALMRFTGRKAAQVAAKPQGISPFSMMSLSNKEQRKDRK